MKSITIEVDVDGGDFEMNELGTEIIKAKVTLVFRGYGYLTLTDKALFWNKSATSYLAFGALNAMTDNHLYIPLDDISKVGTYTYFPGGGLVVTTNQGEEFKVAFKHKKDFKVVYDYLLQR
jgi:hypothetical protein